MSTPYATPAPPKLATLHTKPTWHNRAGRIDRSACFVITASKLWRDVPDGDWKYRFKQPRCDASQVKPRQRVASRLKGLCDRYATRNLYARDLWMLHKCQQPYPLQGDFRTAKSNALRHTPRPVDQRGDRPCAQGMRQDNILGHGPTNPNRGVGFNLYKMLGLDCLWQTTLRIERYVQHAKLKQHFLVCPVCAPIAAGQRTGVPVAAGSQPGGPAANNPPSGRGPTATLGGTSPPANTHRDKLPGGLPPGRVTKLYLPLCTERELNDAHFAQLWLKTHLHPNRPLPPIAVQLIERYGELFNSSGGRQLRCRQCLGLRYGEVKRNTATPRSRRATPRRTKQSQTSVEALLNGFKKTPPRATRRLTEQSLFLTNLPKLLAPVPDASPTQRRRAAAPNQSSIINHPPNPIDALPAADQDQLLLSLFTTLPAFKSLAQAKQLTK